MDRTYALRVRAVSFYSVLDAVFAFCESMVKNIRLLSVLTLAYVAFFASDLGAHNHHDGVNPYASPTTATAGAGKIHKHEWTKEEFAAAFYHIEKSVNNGKENASVDLMLRVNALASYAISGTAPTADFDPFSKANVDRIYSKAYSQEWVKKVQQSAGSEKILGFVKLSLIHI